MTNESLCVELDVRFGKGMQKLERMAKDFSYSAIIENDAPHAAMMEYGGKMIYKMKASPDAPIRTEASMTKTAGLRVVIYNKTKPTPQREIGKVEKPSGVTVSKTKSQTTVVYKPHFMLRNATKAARAKMRSIIRAEIKSTGYFAAGQARSVLVGTAEHAYHVAREGTPGRNELYNSWNLRFGHA